jgi:hypothetical protein
MLLGLIAMKGNMQKLKRESRCVMAFKIDTGGVWRTVGGRRIFIKDGQDLQIAMRGSGKFQKAADTNRVKYWTEKVHNSKTNNIKPFKKEEVNLKKVKDRGEINDEEAKECIELAEEIYAKAEAVEPQISKDIIDSAKKYNGEMYGLDFRMKQPTSLAAKIGADVKEADNRITFKEAAGDVKDAVRYTVILDDDNFTKGYQNIKNDLESKGYKETRMKNFYQMYKDGDASQKAIQCVYEDKNGYVFEFQYHTDNSQGAKEVNHPYYEEWRNKTTSDSRKGQLDELMKSTGKQVKDPKDVYTLKSYKLDKNGNKVYI